MPSVNRWKIGTIVAVVVLGLYFGLARIGHSDPRAHDTSNVAENSDFDQQGGSYLLLEVDTDKVIEDRVASLQSDIRGEMRNEDDGGIGFDQLTIDGDSTIVPITDAANMDQAYKRLTTLSKPLGGLVGGSARDLKVTRNDRNNTVTLTLTDEAKEYYANEAVADSIGVVRLRIDALGGAEPQIARQGMNRLVVQVPGDSDSEGLQNVINRTGRLTFHMVDETADPSAPLPPGRIRLMTTYGVPLVLMETPEITGDMMADASASPNNDNGGFQVNFSFDDRGTKRLRDLTINNIGRTFAIVLDGQIISAPRIQSPITGGSGRITGSFSPKEATELAVLIRSGALQAPLKTIEQRTVAPKPGADVIGDGTQSVVKEEKK